MTVVIDCLSAHYLWLSTGSPVARAGILRVQSHHAFPSGSFLELAEVVVGKGPAAAAAAAAQAGAGNRSHIWCVQVADYRAIGCDPCSMSMEDKTHESWFAADQR
jgi:hypothetical protein